MPRSTFWARLKQTVAPRHPSRAGFTEEQVRYPAFIHAYTKIHLSPPAEADMQRHFGVTLPTVHEKVFNLDRARLIERIPGQPRSIRLLVSPGKSADTELNRFNASNSR